MQGFYHQPYGTLKGSRNCNRKHDWRPPKAFKTVRKEHRNMPRGSKYPRIQASGSRTPVKAWCLEPETSNIGCLEPLGFRGALGRMAIPEGTSTQYLRLPVPKSSFNGFRSQEPQISVLGPSGMRMLQAFQTPCFG